MPLRNNIVTGNPYRIPFRYQLRGIGTERDIYYSIPTHKLQRAFISHAFRQINRNRRMEIDRRYFVLYCVCGKKIKNCDSTFSIFFAYFRASSIGTYAFALPSYSNKKKLKERNVCLEIIFIKSTNLILSLKKVFIFYFLISLVINFFSNKKGK